MLLACFLIQLPTTRRHLVIIASPRSVYRSSSLPRGAAQHAECLDRERWAGGGGGCLGLQPLQDITPILALYIVYVYTAI